MSFELILLGLGLKSRRTTKNFKEFIFANPYLILTGAEVTPSDPPSTEVRTNENGEVMPNHCSMWFIGLVFEKTNVNVDLTYDISSFTKTVHYHAENTNMLREGMTIEVSFVMITHHYVTQTHHAIFHTCQ